MTKLYYDDPLIAAYMFREFDITFRSELDDHIGFDGDLHLLAERNQGEVYEGKYCIHLDSLDVFKPQVGDMVRFRGEFGASVYATDLFKIPSDRTDYSDPCFSFYSDICSKEIIQRDNKAFFMPKVEE